MVFILNIEPIDKQSFIGPIVVPECKKNATTLLVRIWDYFGIGRTVFFN